MAKEQRRYRRLPGKKKNFLLGYQTLWLGPDHLLSVESTRFRENYKRFYYGDIQSIITRKTVTGKIQNLFLTGFCGLFALIALVGGDRLTFFWVFAGLFLIALGINHWKGPSCVCHIQTAVQREKLSPLNRLKRVRKALNLLRPLIERAQGDLTSDAFNENEG